MTIKNMPEQIPQKSNKPESLEEKPKSFEWLSGMLAHYVGHFLLLSREMEKYHARHLEKSKEMVKVMRERVDDAGLNSVLLADLISALDKLQDELENIDLQSSKVDKSLLEKANTIVEIPKKGIHPSLNVATTCGIIVNHIVNNYKITLPKISPHT